jgi:hypothetical protein
MRASYYLIIASKEMVESLTLEDIGLAMNTEGFGPVQGLQPWSDEFDGKLY